MNVDAMAVALGKAVRDALEADGYEVCAESTDDWIVTKDGAEVSGPTIWDYVHLVMHGKFPEPEKPKLSARERAKVRIDELRQSVESDMRRADKAEPGCEVWRLAYVDAFEKERRKLSLMRHHKIYVPADECFTHRLRHERVGSAVEFFAELYRGDNPAPVVRVLATVRAEWGVDFLKSRDRANYLMRQWELRHGSKRLSDAGDSDV